LGCFAKSTSDLIIIIIKNNLGQILYTILYCKGILPYSVAGVHNLGLSRALKRNINPEINTVSKDLEPIQVVEML